MTDVRPVDLSAASVTNIPVRDSAGKRLPAPLIAAMVAGFLTHARQHPDCRYRVTAKGWGYPPRVVAPMFDYAPHNVSLPYEFMY